MVTINDISYEYQAGLTVFDMFSRLGIMRDNLVLIMIGSRLVSWNQLDQEIIEDGMEIKTLRIISGG